MSGCSTCPSASGCSTEKKVTCGEKNTNPFNKIKKVIGVMSGKGGVGKSTVTVLLAKELQARGYKVGILDGDITGPSIPRLTGIREERAEAVSETEIFPVTTKEGIKVISLNLLLEDENEPVVWRGPVVGNVVKQFWNDVIWGELDFLLIDMPPGTGDVALTVMQSLPLDGVVMVSVPQDMVSMIVAKAVNMTKKMNVPVLGLVENMSYIVCPGCETIIHFHDNNGGKDSLKEMNLNLLGELPMKQEIAKMTQGDDSGIGMIFKEIADRFLKVVK
ncbi:Mrp/NBP35 family ATP-binding protein [Fusobacterium gonidiaformans]|uniref:Mrp/NBP35 family ATP-binding protein n=1 Tax=Fusobacterium gonidiaformans TaxID=849 RepID=UPI0001BC65BA|nr:Mrp/NBP35 family ATP-binding protein [Fusobacterium gonidiaformans]AVQ16069.1 ATP-binding protein [Fusobacterium gonidiaformans ATCC 25563]EFS28708.1 hypothetical protein FGAG_01029 [Fusobacterium gonidiaformans ATCC 25563]